MNVFCRQPLAFLQDMQAISRLLLVSLLGLCRETLNRCRKRGGEGTEGRGRRWGGGGEENLAKTDWDEGKDRSREGQPGRGGGGGWRMCPKAHVRIFWDAGRIKLWVTEFNPRNAGGLWPRRVCFFSMMNVRSLYDHVKREQSRFAKLQSTRTMADTPRYIADVYMFADSLIGRSANTLARSSGTQTSPYVRFRLVNRRLT